MKKLNRFGLVVASAIFAIALVCLNACLGSGSTKALSPQDEADFAQNNNLFYEPCETGGQTAEICGTNKNYAGEQVWTDKNLEAVKANSPFYQKAAEQYDIPWQILAVLHMREHGLARSNPSNGQGVYQFYSAAERAKCQGGNFLPGKISDEQFQIQTNCAAKRVKEGYGSGLDLTKDDDIKKMFFRYNGTAAVYKTQALKLGFSQMQAENGEGSPYVMNRYDAKREPSSTWGQIKRDGGGIEYPANKDFGAFVYYKAITCDGSNNSEALGTEEEILDDDEEDDDIDGEEGMNERLIEDSNEELPSGGNGSGVSCNGSNEGSKNLNAAAVALAWPEGNDSKAKYESGSATKAFQDAHKKFTPGSNSCKGADCGLFVSTVVRFSGYDSNYPEVYVPNQYEYVEMHPKLWEIIDWSDGDKSKAKPGDIVFENGNGHTMFIVEDSKGEIKYASASQCRYYGKIKNFYAPRQPAKLARAKSANNSTSGVSSTSGVTPSSNDGTIAATGQNNGDINASAIALAWPENKYESVYKKKATDAFANYFDSLPGKNRSECWAKGKACSVFVNTVLSYAGAKKTGVKKIRDVGTVRKDLEADEDWEEIQPAGDKFKESDLQPGDVIFYYRKKADSRTGVDKWKGLYVNHVAIYVETPEGGRIAQAHHCKAFGYISTNRLPNGKKNVRVYRWKKQGNNTQASCDVCAGESGNGGAVSGGLSMEQAKALMKKYRELPSSQWKTYNLTGYSCPGGPVANCVSFSNYFVQKYTTYGKAVGGDGGVYAKNLASKAGLDHGNEPRPYAVFSKATGSTMCGNHLCGHTGVVLNVDKERNKILIGEAGCSMPNSWTGVHEYDLKAWTGGSNYYAYTDSIMNLDEVNKDAQ